MKSFEYWDYNSTCPLAKKVEDAMNDCGSAKSHLAKMDSVFENPMDMFKFMVACVGYWAETPYYDERNTYAVLHSRKIMAEFDGLKEMAETLDDENILLNAFGFTHSAHRYLQNEFFKTILCRWEQNNDSVHLWLQKMEFVYNDDRTDLVPYAEVRAKRGW